MAGETGLELPLEQFHNISNFKKLVDIRTEKGWLVRDGRIESWSFEGFRYRDGRPFLYGPPAPGVPLGAALAWPRDKALAAVERIIRALVVLAGDAGKNVDISPESVWLLDDGGTLFLPAEVFRKLRLLSRDEYKTGYSRLNDPYDAPEADKRSHTVGVLVYRALTGRFPFDGRDLDEIHARIRQQKVIPPQFIDPDVKRLISDRLVRFFEKKEALSLDDWLASVSGWIAGGFTEPLGAAEAAEIQGRRVKLEERHDRGFARKVFFEKYAKTMLVTALAVAAAGVFAGSLIFNALQPRRTAGFTPLKVVQTYYQSIDELNPELMGDCLKGDAGASERQRAEFTFVNTRQMISMTHEDYRVPAGAWAKNGRPRIDPPLYVDGVAGLTLTEIRSGTQWEFEAAYERWLEEPGTGPEDKTLFETGTRVKERLTLVKDDQGWLISNIRRLSSTPFYKSQYGYQPVVSPPKSTETPAAPQP